MLTWNIDIMNIQNGKMNYTFAYSPVVSYMAYKLVYLCLVAGCVIYSMSVLKVERIKVLNAMERQMKNKQKK